MNRQQRREIVELLRESGVPHEIRCGKKHRQILVAGQIVSKVPRGAKGNDCGHQHKNVIAAIKRAIRSRSID